MAVKAFFNIACLDGSELTIEGIGAARQALGLKTPKGRSREARILAAVAGLPGYELIAHRVDSRRRVIVSLREVGQAAPPKLRAVWPFPLVALGDGLRYTGDDTAPLALP